MPVSKHFVRDLLGPILILTVPVAAFLFIFLLNLMDRRALIQFVSANWGNLASVWGLVLGFYLVAVATGARRAAEQARVRSTRQSLTEELEEAKSRIEQLGHFLAAENMEVVRIRAEEVLHNCQSVLGRWGTEPEWEDSRNTLLSVADIVRTLGERIANGGRLTASDVRQMRLAQLHASEKLSAVLAGSRGFQERNQ